MPETRPPLELQGLSLADLQKLIDERRLPPVDRWDPQHCGHSEMRIARDGTWYHRGSPINRPAMVRLFSTVLRRDPDGSHVLVTPVEKLEIDVEPYVILGACNPTLAHQALQAEPDLGVLLPCNVVVYERNGVTHVSAVDAERMLSIVENDQLADVAQDVRHRLGNVVDRVVSDQHV